MSRTYRRRNIDQFGRGWFSPLRDHEWVTDRNGYQYLVTVRIDPKSEEGKRKLAQFRSDRGHGWLDYKGPSWFRTQFAQVPYRARARQELINWMKNPNEREVCIERKPFLPYWL